MGEDKGKQTKQESSEIPQQGIPDDELFRRHQRYVGIGRNEATSIVDAIKDDNEQPQEKSEMPQTLREMKGKKRKSNSSSSDPKRPKQSAHDVEFRKPQ